MILCASKKFNDKALSEIKTIYDMIKKELPEIPKWQMNNSYLIENKRTISYCTITDEDKKMIGHSIEIKNDNDTYTYALSLPEKLEVIKADNNNLTCEKYQVELIDDDVIVVRSLFAVDDFLSIKKNQTTGKIDISGSIIDKINLPYDEDLYSDEMDYLKACLVCVNQQEVVRKR